MTGSAVMAGLKCSVIKRRQKKKSHPVVIALEALMWEKYVWGQFMHHTSRILSYLREVECNLFADTKAQ